LKTDRGLAEFNDYMKSRSYVEGWSFSAADTALFDKIGLCPDASKKYPHLYRWFIHIASLKGVGIGGFLARQSAPYPAVLVNQEQSGAETLLARRKKEAEERTAQKEAKQRTLVAIEIKPFDVEQDLMALWKKITNNIKQEGLKWGEGCTLAPVAFGIKKIQTTFTMGINNSSEEVLEAIEAYEDEVQSVEITAMNVL
jgi:elongation factor 1-beta